MPGVKGRLDHMNVDVESKRLFVAAVEKRSMEVVDLEGGRWTRSISGFQDTHRDLLCARTQQGLRGQSRRWHGPNLPGGHTRSNRLSKTGTWGKPDHL